MFEHARVMKLKLNDNKINNKVNDRAFEYYINFAKSIQLSIGRMSHHELRLASTVFKRSLNKLGRKIYINYSEMTDLNKEAMS